jgi:hypothetical protein
MPSRWQNHLVLESYRLFTFLSKSDVNALDITQASGKLTATFPWKRRSTTVPTGWNSLKISLPKVISRVFTGKFQNINIASVSGHSGRFIFKICQTIAGIKYNQSISRFLWISFLAGYCYLAQLSGGASFADCLGSISLA